jgi:predicted ATPase/DNA-binding CsgD family transcriptional regulator
MEDNLQVSDRLTERENEILVRLSTGLSDQQIADDLFLSLSTVKWYNRQIYSKLHVQNRTQAIARARALEQLPSDAKLRQRHNLPTQTTSFIGREREIASYANLLRQEDCRLLTLIGPGGIGKTRLALQIAKQLQPEFAHGVYFVVLQPLTSPDGVTAAIAQAVDYPFAFTDRSVEQQVLDYLGDKHLLLLMDNFEHLLDAASLVASILQNAPKVKLLVTSREALRLQEEWLREVKGLYIDENPRDAIRLFAERARQMTADFNLEAERDDVIRLCQLVEGVPLALELAASWRRSMSCATIAAEIQTNVDILSTDARNIAERHQSIRAVFDHSWRLLTDAEQQVFGRLSVFYGGFTREAAETVAGADLRTLTTLVDKCLIRHDAELDRYTLHELLRQYAAQQLEACGFEEDTRTAHCVFFLHFAHQQAKILFTHEQLNVVDRIDLEWNNLHRAWMHAVTTAREDLLVHAADLCPYFEIRCRWQEGKPLVEMALQITSDENRLLLEKLKASLALLSLRTGQVDQASALAQQCLDNRQGIVDDWPQFMALLVLNIIRWEAEDFEQMERTAREGLERTQRVNNRTWQAIFMGNHGITLMYLRRYEEAEQTLSQALSLKQTQGNYWGMLFDRENLAEVYYVLQNYEKAEPLIDETLYWAKRIRNPWMEATCYDWLATFAVARDAPEQALSYLDKNAHLESQYHFRHQEVSFTELTQAAAYSMLGEVGKARHLASALLDASRSSASWCAGLLAVGYILLDQQEPARALELAAVVLEQPITVGLEGVAYELMGRVRSQLDETSYAAIFEQGQTLDFVETIAQVRLFLRT